MVRSEHVQTIEFAEFALEHIEHDINFSLDENLLLHLLVKIRVFFQDSYT